MRGTIIKMTSIPTNFPVRRCLVQVLVACLLLASRQSKAYDVTISSGASSGGIWSGSNPDVWTPNATASNVSTADIQSKMAAGGVIISADNAGAENGDIIVNDVITWSANTTLTLSAFRNIEVNANIAAIGNMAGLTLAPNTGATGGSYSLASSITLSGSTPSLNISGTSYTVINDVTALQSMNNNLLGNYALGSNIDASATSGWNAGAGFSPVGTAPTASPFSGTFNGLGHTINNLVINLPISDSVGLFGYTSTGSVVQNVGLLGGSVSGNNSVGGLVGTNFGTVINSYFTGSVSGNNSSTGLAVGMNYGTVINSYSTGSVSGSNYGSVSGGNVGGLVGSGSGTISNSYLYGAANTGSLTINTTGGLMGSGSILTTGATVTVTQSTQTAIINWNSFNIGAGATVNFVQPSSSSVALNRITTTNPTTIFGQLTSNGSVYLVNPAGVLFGSTCILDPSALSTSPGTPADAASLGLDQ